MKAKVIVTAAMLVVGGMASAQEDSKYYMNVETAPDKVQSYEVNPDLKVSWEPTRKGANPSGYYTKDEVDAKLQKNEDLWWRVYDAIIREIEDNQTELGEVGATLKDINDILLGETITLDGAKDIVGRTGAIRKLKNHEINLGDHHLYLEEICRLLTGSRDNLTYITDYWDGDSEGVLSYIKGHQSTLENICNLLVHSSYLLEEDVEHYKKEYFPLGVLEFIREKHTTPVKARDDSSMELMEENKVLKDNVEDMQKEIEKLKREKEDLSKQINDLMGRIEALEKK